MVKMAISPCRRSLRTYGQSFSPLISQDPSMGLLWNHGWGACVVDRHETPQLGGRNRRPRAKWSFSLIKKGKKEEEKKGECSTSAHRNTNFRCPYKEVKHMGRNVRTYTTINCNLNKIKRQRNTWNLRISWIGNINGPVWSASSMKGYT